MRTLVQLAIVGSVLIATSPAALAKNPFAPGQLKKRLGPVPGYPGASAGKIIDPSIAPHVGEVVDQKQGGPDKFLGSDLDQRLKDHGIKTVILCATSAQGVGLRPSAATTWSIQWIACRRRVCSAKPMRPGTWAAADRR
jgi:hypothetical protein